MVTPRLLNGSVVGKAAVMPKSLWLGLFILVIAICVAFGVARDLYSRERGTVRGTVVEAETGSTSPKSPGLTPTKIRAKLANGEVVDVVTKETRAIAPGTEIEISERVTPWGQVWYKLKG